MKIVLSDCKAISWNKLYQARHWAVRAKIASDAHETVQKALDSMKWTMYTSQVNIKMIAHLRRSIDASNVCLKIYEDGLVRAGLLKDDSHEYVNEVTCSVMKDTKDWAEIIITKA